MPYDPNIHHRRSIRLKGDDYASLGACFATICTQGRLPLLGQVVGDRVALSPAGEMVRDALANLRDDCPGVHPARFTVMPNHVHVIICIEPRESDNAPLWPLGNVVGRFKSVTTVRYAAGVRDLRWPPFDGQLRQRNYYEHIIRDERDLDAIRVYIANNPPQWSMDRENPERR